MRGILITDDIFASDLMNENFPYRFALAEALHSGHWPLWVREIYGGFPLLARSEAGVCYPINIILFGLFPPYVALNLTILLIIGTGAVGMYRYAREISANHVASTLAGVAFGFCGYLISHLKHLSMANAACWLPIGLLLIERAVKTNTCYPLLWFGVVFGLQNLAGNAQIAYYSGVLYLLYFICRLLETLGHLPSSRNTPAATGTIRRLLKSHLTWSFVGVSVLAVLLAAVQLIPTYELVSYSQRAGGVTFEYASKYAYDLRDAWMFVAPFANGDIGNLTYTGKGVFWEDYGYVGALTFLLALYSSLCCWRTWHVRFFSISAIASYIVVLGPTTPLYRMLFNYLPGFSYFRFPTRLLLVTDLSLIALAAVGLTKGSDRVGMGASSVPVWRARLASVGPATLLVVTICDLLFFQLRQNPIVDSGLWVKPPQTAEIVRRDPELFRMFCLGGNHSHRQMFEQARGWEGSLQPFLDQREFIQPSSNALYGIASPNGYANLTPNYLVDIWGDQNRAGLITQSGSIQGNVFAATPLFWKLMRLYNVKYLTSFWPLAPADNLEAMGIYGGAHLYRNRDFLPRSYLVGDVIAVGEGHSDVALEIVRSASFDPARSVILPVVPPDYHGGQFSRGSVEMLRYASDEAEMKVQTTQSAILVFSDSYYPGWVADIDGHETTIYRANVTQRAVFVPGGQHNVRFRFRPKSVAVGLSISMGALALILLLFLTHWVRRPNPMLADNKAPDLPS